MMKEFVKKHLLVIVLFAVLIIALISQRLTINNHNSDKVKNKKTEIKAIEADLNANKKETTAVTDNLSETGKQAVKQAEIHRDNAYKNSTVADTDRNSKFSYLTRK